MTTPGQALSRIEQSPAGLVPASPPPPILHGRDTPAVQAEVAAFYHQVAEIFDRWVARRESPHTQRAYRDDVMTFIRFMGWRWPDDAPRLLEVTLANTLAFRDALRTANAAPKTINRRISSLSAFYKYLAGAAAELRLPIMVPNPAHAQFIPRAVSDPRTETRALSAAQARRLLRLPQGESVLATRDRAIFATYLYTGIRLSTGCQLAVHDFHHDGEHATLRLSEKGGRRRRIGLHAAAAEALTDYIARAGLTGGPLFRPREHARTEALADRAMDETTMWRLMEAYLRRLPGAVQQVPRADGALVATCVYTPHSLRATTATLLLEAGVDIAKVQALLGHRHLTTTQIYDKRRRSTADSASHSVPL